MFKNFKLQSFTIPVLLLVLYFFIKAKKLGQSVGQSLTTDAQVQAINQTMIDNNLSAINTQKVTDIVTKIYNAFYKNDWFGWTEDEATAIAAFNQLSNIPEAKAASKIYFISYSKNMHADFTRFCNTSQLNTANFNAIN